MNISFEGIGQEMVTFAADDGVAKGKPVKMSANGKVSACADGDAFIGVAANVASDGAANVIMRGFVELDYTGTAPALGLVTIAGNGSGGIKTVTANGRQVTSVNVDTANKTVCIYM